MGRHKKQPDRPINLCAQWPEPQSEQQENRGDRELLRETDGEHARGVDRGSGSQGFEVSQSCHQLAERQRHRLCWFIFQFATGVLSACSVD